MQEETYKNGSRVAKIQDTKQGFMVYVGFEGNPEIPGEETIPANFFNGTCCRTYKTEKGARAAVNRFFNEGNDTDKKVEAIAKEFVQPVFRYVAAKTKAEMMHDFMNSWDRKELALTWYEAAPEFVDAVGSDRITEPKLTYMMLDSDYRIFEKKRNEYIASLNLDGIRQGECPALVYHHQQIKIEREILDLAGKLIDENLSADTVLRAGLVMREKVIENIVKMAMAYHLEHENEN